MTDEVTHIMDLEQKILELERKAEFFRLITDSTYDWEEFHDRYGRLIYVNKAFERITGYSADEILNGSVTEKDFIHPDDLPMAELNFKRAMDHETIEDFNFRIVRKEGSIGYVNLYAIPVFSDDDFAGIRTSIRDISMHNLMESSPHENNRDSIKQDLELRLSHSLRLLDYVIEHDHTAIALLDRNFKYIYVSQRFLSDYNVEQKDVLGKSHYEIFPDLPDNWRIVHQKALNGEVIRADEDAYVKEDGTVTWVRWECRPWYESDGSIGGIILYTEVITRQKEAELELLKAKEKAEESESIKSDILAKLNDAQHIAKIGSWDWNLRTGKIWWSDEVFNIFEVDPFVYIPSVERNSEFIHPDDSDAFWMAVRIARETGEILNHQFRIITADGITKHCKTTARVYYDAYKNAERLSGTFIDITEQVLSHNQLIEAKEKAEESNHLKTAFLQNMSHEVRTPLNSIVGFSRLLSDPGHSPEKIRNFSDIISENSDKLIGIITDVIEIARIQANQIKIIPVKFNVVQVISKITGVYNERANRKDLAFLFHQNISANNASIISDKGKLEKIFIHLIDNALKYTNKGSVEVLCEIENGNLKFSVSDTGIGIAPANQKIIFEPFHQIERELSSDYGGNGLGLSIIRSYTSLLKGSISLNSKKNSGTVIEITIPVIISESFSDSHEGATADNVKKSHVNTILIAEDEISNYKYLYEVLHSDNMNIIHATNGKEALEICRNCNAISMILMDIKMPVMDGKSATKLIKEFRPGLPVIAQTAYIPDSEKTDYLDVFDDLIAKPINRNDLKKKMKKYIDF